MASIIPIPLNALTHVIIHKFIIPNHILLIKNGTRTLKFSLAVTKFYIVEWKSKSVIILGTNSALPAYCRLVSKAPCCF